MKKVYMISYAPSYDNLETQRGRSKYYPTLEEAIERAREGLHKHNTRTDHFYIMESVAVVKRVNNPEIVVTSILDDGEKEEEICAPINNGLKNDKGESQEPWCSQYIASCLRGKHFQWRRRNGWNWKNKK